MVFEGSNLAIVGLETESSSKPASFKYIYMQSYLQCIWQE